MSCTLNDSQIQSWLDGDTDESLHLSECPECQQRMLSMQKLRSRLTPPPSPLGRDFARRTAQHIVRVTEATRPHKPSGGWWNKLRDNPLVHVVQRERSRRLLRLPGLAAILLLYLLPGGFVFQYGEADANWAYFGMVQVGLTLLLPLFLLSLEWTTLSTLVRGRCLEEMLQAGLEPVLVSDTLALCGLRSLLPALFMIGIALLPMHPQSLLVWLPMTAIAFSAAGYLSQAHLLGLRWPRWLSFLGAAAVGGSLAAPGPWNVVSASLLAVLGLAARRQSITSLELQQQGRLPSTVRHARGGAWQLWLARRLPDLALLQRELRRRNLLTPSILVGNLGVCVAAYTAFGSGAFSWPLLAGTAGLLAAFSLVQREKDGGAYEVLHHSGIRPADYWASGVWIAGLQFLPAGLAAVVFTFHKLWDFSPFSACAAALGTAISLFVSLRAGAVIGASIAVDAQNPRQASTRCIQEVAILCFCSLLLLGLVAPIFGQGSPLALLLRALGMQITDALDGIAILPVMLALHLRARLLSGRGAGFNPWTYSLAALVPLCLWFQMASSLYYRYNNTEANSCTGLALLVGLIWAWWAAPLAQKPGKARWVFLAASYTVILLLGAPALSWSFSLMGSIQYNYLPIGISEIDWMQTSAIVAACAWLIYLLGKRMAWSAPPALHFGRRSLWSGSLAIGVLAWLTLGIASYATAPRPHSGEFASFLAANSYPIDSTPSQMRRLLRQANIYAPAYRNLNLMLSAPYELRGMKGREQSFEDLLQPLLQDPSSGTLRDREGAASALCLQADLALYSRQPQRYLDRFEKLTRLSIQADQRRTGSMVALCRSLRTQLLLALRTQSWSLKELKQLDRLQASLPDGPTQLQAGRDQSAAGHYRDMLSQRSEMYLPLNHDPVANFFMKHQAEAYLNSYLSDRSGLTTSRSRNFLFWVSRWRDGSAPEREFLRAANRLVIDIESYRQVHGSYPESWSRHPKGIRLAYQRLGPSYYLKLWMPQADSYPIILSTRGEEWKINRGEY